MDCVKASLNVSGTTVELYVSVLRIGLDGERGIEGMNVDAAPSWNGSVLV